MSDSASRRQHSIVVGIDGSEASKDALRWAAGQAELTGASLRAVMAWHIPMVAYGNVVTVPVDADLEGEGRRVLEQVVTEVLGANLTINLSAVVVEGPPATELLEAAQTVELLVVGSRGFGAFAGMSPLRRRSGENVRVHGVEIGGTDTRRRAVRLRLPPTSTTKSGTPKGPPASCMT